LLSLEFLSDRAFPRLLKTTIFSFNASKGDKQIEADFGLFWQDSSRGEIQSGVAFGECKSYNLFEKKDFLRMKELAKQFPGAILIFATLRKELTPTEIKELTKLTKDGRRLWKAER